MKGKRDFYRIIAEICDRDRRYKPDGYEFVMRGLYFTQTRLKRKGHIKGGEFAEGLREFAIEQYGPMAKTVLNHWGITKTQDFGNIVFNLIDKKILSKDESDSVGDFKDIYNFDIAFSNILNKNIIPNRF